MHFAPINNPHLYTTKVYTRHSRKKTELAILLFFTMRLYASQIPQVAPVAMTITP